MVTSKNTNSSHGSDHPHDPRWLIILLLIIGLVNIVSLFFLTGNSLSLFADPVGIKKAILEVEYAKVGGKENYDILARAQQLSLTDTSNPSNLDAMKKYIASFDSGATAAATTTSGSTDPSTLPTLSSGAIATILSGVTIEDNKDANIVVVEYTDMECPFCIKQYNDTQLSQKLMAQYGDKIAYIFKNNRGVNHPGTEAKALGALCAQAVGGDSAYVAFYQGIMSGTTQESKFPVADLPKLAKSIGLNTGEWQQCMDSKEMMAKFTEETKEAAQYGLGGTPGVLIFNRTTGAYTTIEGAYPYTQFTAKIDSLLQ